MINLIPFLILSAIWMTSLTMASLSFYLIPDFHPLAFGSKLLLAFWAFALAFVFSGGLISSVSHKKIIRGKFPRQPFHKIYFWRRIYGCCWTAVYYFKPLYHVILSVPVLKKLTLRMFGYKGNTDFTVYPDTWIRDLPLLSIGKSAYLSNRATIGTNMCLSDGTILVDRITVGERSIVGHLVMLAPGVALGNDVELGSGCGVGMRARIGDGTKVGPYCLVYHGAQLGKNVNIGIYSVIGLQAQIADGIKIPPGSLIPAGAVINTQEEAKQYVSSEVRVPTISAIQDSIKEIEGEKLEERPVQIIR